MKIVYIIVPLLILGALIFFFLRQKPIVEGPTEQVKAINQEERVNPYLDLRSLAFNTKPGDIGLPEEGLFGLLVDWDIGQATITLVTYKTGDASLYFSSGGGIIGGGQHEPVREAVLILLEKADAYVEKAQPVDHSDLPSTGEAYFYFLTAEGRFLISDDFEDIENGSSELTELFKYANDVITQIRLNTEK